MLSKKNLVLYTTAVLLLVGAVSVYGIFLYQANQSGDPRWTTTESYNEYVEGMNLLATPGVAAIMVLLTICIPRRLLTKDKLIKVAGSVILASAAATVLAGLVTGLTLLLSATAGVQLISLVETLRGAELNYRKKGHAAHVGSALLHLGVVVLLLDLTAVPKTHPSHIPLFWISTALFLVGMTLSFFPETGRALSNAIEVSAD